MERKTTKALILNTNEAEGVVECVFSVFGVLDSGNDIVHNGAFRKTWGERGDKIKLLDSHNTGSVLSSLGKPLEFRELSRVELPQRIQDEHPEATGGAWAKVQFNMKTQAGHDSFWHIAHGDTDEWSFGYDAIDRDHSKINYRGKEVVARNLRTVKQYELSPVIFGMNSVTTTTGAKAQEEESIPEDDKAGRVLSGRNATRIRAALDALNETLKEAGLLEIEEASDDEKDGWLCDTCYKSLGKEYECFTDSDVLGTGQKCAHCGKAEVKHHLVKLPKKTGATGPQKSEEPPTSSEAGPAEDDSTRYLKLIEIEQEALRLLEV